MVPPDPRHPLTPVARELMAEYAAMPHIVGRWSNPAHDLAQLPFPFVAPRGHLLVAMDGEAPVGCGALRTMAEPGMAEIKRVYVRSNARGKGVGELLMRALLAQAVELDCRTVRLDTAPELAAARALYLRLGFTPIPAYGDARFQDSICFEWRAAAENTPGL